jgi:hypothetical protein
MRIAVFIRRGISFLAAATVAIATVPPSQALSLGISIGGYNLTEGLINLSCGLLGQANVCVRVVTHAVVNGSTVERERDIAPGFGALGSVAAQAIDVTGDGVADVSVSISVPVTLLPPGYDTQKPTLKVSKLSSAPALLPLKLEVVTNDGAVSGRKISFGYDSRSSTAPTTFTAAIDQSDRDHSAQTSQVLVNLTIAAGNSKGVGLVQESFVPGSDLSETQRQDRSITALTFRAEAATTTLPATQMPTSVRLDATSSDGSQHFVVTSSPASTADVLIAKPDDDPKITGTIARLPGTVDLKLASTDTDADGTADQTAVDYTGSQAVPQAQLSFNELARDENPDGANLPPIEHRRTLGVTASGLPGALGFVFSSKASTVHVSSSARIPSVVVNGVDELPFFKRATTIELTLTDVPRIVDAGFKDGHITFDGQAPDAQGHPGADALGTLQFRAYDVVPPSHEVCLPPLDCDIFGDARASGVIFTDTSSDIFIGGPFLLQARVFKLKSADVVSEPDLNVYVDTAPDVSTSPLCQVTPDLNCESFRPFIALITKADPRFRESITTIRAALSALLPGTLFRQATFGESTAGNPDDDYGLIAYSNDGTRGSPNLVVDSTNLPGLPTGKNGQGAKQLHVALTGMPNSLNFTYAGGGFPLKFDAYGASDDTLDKLEVRMNSMGATDRLAQSEGGRKLDGVMIRDFEDRFVIDARLRGLRHAIVDKDVHLRPDPCEPFSPDCGVIEVGAKALPSAPPPYPCSEHDEICIQAGVADNADHPKLRFDSQTGIAPFAGPPGDGWDLVHTKDSSATLDDIPSTLTLRKFTGADDEARLIWDASRAVGAGLSQHDGDVTKQFLDGVHIDGGDQVATTDTGIVPMPAHFDTCKSADKATCSAAAFGRDVADSGSFSLNASERTHLTLLDIPNHDHLDTFTNIDLTFKNFTQAANASGRDSYIGLDTGWDATLGDPPESAKVSGLIQHYRGYAFYQEGEEFRIPAGFAADGRIVSWYSTLELLVAQNAGDVYPIERYGKVSCPSNIAIDLTREVVNDSTITIDLGDDLCLHDGIGDPTPD